MDLIGALTSQLGVGQGDAEGLAGTVMGLVKNGLSEKGEQGALDGLSQAVPEMGGWLSAASQLAAKPAASEAAGGFDVGGLVSAGLGALGGDKAQALGPVVSVLSKVGLDGSKASMVGSLVVQFLQSRLDSGLLSKITAAVPLLSALGGGSDGPKSPLGGMLGGLLG